MLFLSNHSEWKQYLQPLTDKQLLKEYRQLQSLLIEIAPCIKSGWFHGESAILQKMDYERGIEQATRELEKRGYRFKGTGIDITIKKAKSYA